MDLRKVRENRLKEQGYKDSPVLMELYLSEEEGCYQINLSYEDAIKIRDSIHRHMGEEGRFIMFKSKDANKNIYMDTIPVNQIRYFRIVIFAKE